jgi:hypothetical protein
MMSFLSVAEPRPAQLCVEGLDGNGAGGQYDEGAVIADPAAQQGDGLEPGAAVRGGPAVQEQPEADPDPGRARIDLGGYCLADQSRG